MKNLVWVVVVAFIAIFVYANTQSATHTSSEIIQDGVVLEQVLLDIEFILAEETNPGSRTIGGWVTIPSNSWGTLSYAYTEALSHAQTNYEGEAKTVMEALVTTTFAATPSNPNSFCSLICLGEGKTSASSGGDICRRREGDNGNHNTIIKGGCCDNGGGFTGTQSNAEYFCFGNAKKDYDGGDLVNACYCEYDTNTYTACSDGDLYWYHSTGERGTKAKECDYGCSEGACQLPEISGDSSSEVFHSFGQIYVALGEQFTTFDHIVSYARGEGCEVMDITPAPHHFAQDVSLERGMTLQQWVDTTFDSITCTGLIEGGTEDTSNPTGNIIASTGCVAISGNYQCTVQAMSGPCSGLSASSVEDSNNDYYGACINLRDIMNNDACTSNKILSVPCTDLTLGSPISYTLTADTDDDGGSQTGGGGGSGGDANLNPN